MDIRRYIYSHCVNPNYVKIWDSYSNSFIVRKVPCGKCLHCLNSSINEWCTRLFAQRKYSKYCYYVSLDYAPFTLSDSVSYQLAKETAACYHNINKYGKYGMHPLVLCKNHLQDFYKRLRKNTKVKLQYFACGEYGMHANGRGFGRPHYHNIIFCNEPITVQDFEKAWTINHYKIGRVDFVDMNGLAFDSSENLKIFKYVCKYLQKKSFDFEKLVTIDFHRAYFESINFVIQEHIDLFSNPFVNEISRFSDSKKDELWKKYISEYSPFIVCSRRPAIGSAYLEDNLERFAKQDFRLFGLSSDCVAFPRYYARKTKEFICPFSCIGVDSEKPTSSSRLGYVLQILDFLYRSRLSIENWANFSPSDWSVYNSKIGDRYERLISLNDFKIPCRSLSFYDNKNKFLYQFDGYFYKIWAKLKDGTFAYLHNMDIIDVLHEFSPIWSNYYKNWIEPLHDKSVLLEKELNDYISKFFNSDEKDSYSNFRDLVYQCYQKELANNYKTKLLMSNSKQNF